MTAQESRTVTHDATTPRPWVPGTRNEHGTVRSPIHGLVAQCGPLGRQDADAALIVEAVNAYDRLRAIEAASRTVLPRLTHGRHCPCTACKNEDWTNPRLAHCGMHGPSCPAVYDPYDRKEYEAAGSSCHCRDERPRGSQESRTVEERCEVCDHPMTEHATPGSECIHARCSCDLAEDIVRGLPELSPTGQWFDKQLLRRVRRIAAIRES